jgi:DNA-binding ferritin-like protein
MKKSIFVAIAAVVIGCVAGKLYQESRVKVEEEDTVSIDDVINSIAKATDELMDEFEKQINEFSKKVDDYLN